MFVFFPCISVAYSNQILDTLRDDSAVERFSAGDGASWEDAWFYAASVPITI